ncbi:hypothetical protein BX600DRAFT_512991 [Xylariales sp. PMI_506]|nr:hypothetical protein BX600DRAFT_512991 [Xylariales sp. PMI_506]
MTSYDLRLENSASPEKYLRHSVSEKSKADISPQLAHWETTQAGSQVVHETVSIATEKLALRPHIAVKDESLSPPPLYSSIAQEPTQSCVEPIEKPTLVHAETTYSESGIPTDAREPSVDADELIEQTIVEFADAPLDASFTRLEKPVFIPRVNPGSNSPFARAWPTALESHDISQEDFLAFIDNLNIICTPHAAIHVVQLASTGIGFVPHDWAEGLSAALNVAAILANLAVTWKRKQKYLLRINEAYFHPRALHVGTISTRRMMERLGLDKKDPLLAPLTEATLDMSAQERCLQHLSRWTSKLTLEDLPPPSLLRTGPLARLARWQVRHSVRKADRQARSSRKRAWKRHQKGKKPREAPGERWRVKMLSWVCVQNLDEWEAEQQAKREKKELRRASSWRTVLSR